MENIKEFIIKNMLCSDGIKINAKKSEKWLETNHPEILNEILKQTEHLKIFKNKINLILNNNGNIICDRCEVNNISENKMRYDIFICDICFKDDVRIRTEKTNIEKYGFKSPAENKTVLDKIKKTNQHRYGQDYHLQSKTSREKIKNTNIKKYGVEVSSKVFGHKISQTKRKKATENIPDIGKYYMENMEKLYSIYIEDNISMTKLSEICGINVTTLTRRFLENGYKIYKKNVSGGENILFNELIKNNPKLKFIQSDRTVLKPKEIDIYIPEKKLGIEYNGWFWHSTDDIKIDLRHKEKYLKSHEIGIQLLQFWDHELIYKYDIVMSIINSKIGSQNKIYARNCEIMEIDNDTYKNFCEENHLQGYGIAKIRLGLFNNGILVSIMSFSKSRFDKIHDYEMIRFCCKLNITIVGGASKLFKYFIDKYDPINIVSYADARISNGNLYKTLGFDFIRHSQPNYFYIKEFGKLESRFSNQKHKLKDKLSKFDPKYTEKENMIMNGYKILYDAGNLVFSYSKQK